MAVKGSAANLTISLRKQAIHQECAYSNFCCIRINVDKQAVSFKYIVGNKWRPTSNTINLTTVYGAGWTGLAPVILALCEKIEK